MAGELGFEPRLTESESAVLPLNYSPPKVPKYLNIFVSFTIRRENLQIRSSISASVSDVHTNGTRRRNQPLLIFAE